MPTKKPRVTFTLTEEQLFKIETYRVENGIKNQTQAILSLLQKAADKISAEASEIAGYSKEALSIAAAYDNAEDRIKQVVKLTLEPYIYRQEEKKLG